jgi:CheY-like chemotaxis protein
MYQLTNEVMANQLRKASCKVHVADHGADALIFLKKTTFAKDCGPSAIPLSIVLMDLEMVRIFTYPIISACN